MTRYKDTFLNIYVWGDDVLKSHLRGGYVNVQPDDDREPSYYAHVDQLIRAPITPYSLQEK